MRRQDNSSFKNYEFDREKFEEENEVECSEVYVKPVDTSVAGLVARGVVANADLNYSTDIPAMDNMSLMEFHKMKISNKDSVARLEEIEKREREYEKERQEAEKVEKVEPKND